MKTRRKAFLAATLWAGLTSCVLAQNADELNSQSIKLHGQGRIEEAIAIAQKVVTLRAAKAEEAPADYASSLNNLAFLYYSKGVYEKAEPLYIKTLEIKAKALGTDHPSYAGSLNNLAELYRAMGTYAKAEPLYIQAKEIRAKVLGADRPEYAGSLSGLALLYLAMGAYEKAEPLFIQAKEIHAKTGRSDHPDYAASLNNLAEVYRAMGAYEKAKPLYIQAKEIWAKTLGTNHPNYATCLSNLAALYDAMGEYENAEPIYIQALEIRAKVLGTNHPDYATSLTGLALLYKSMGAYVKAEPLYLQANEIDAKSVGPKHPLFATSLHNLAALYQAMGAYEKAEPLYIQAKEIKAMALGTAHPSYATSLNNLAGMYAMMDAHEKAEPLFIQVKEIWAKSLGTDHPLYATSLNNLAESYRAMGRYEKAEPLYLHAKGIYAKALGTDHPDYAGCLENLAYLYKAQNKPKVAEPLIRELLRIERVMLGRVLGAFPEKAREQYVQSLKLYDLPAALERGPLMTESLIAFKGAIGASLLEEKRLLQAAKNPQAAVQVAQLQDLRSQFQHATLQGQKQRAEDLFARIENLEKELSRFVTGLGQTRRSVQITAGEVQAVLPADTALVELARYRRRVRDENKKLSWQDRYGAVVLRHEGGPAFVNLALGDELDKAVQVFRAQAEGKASNRDAEQAARRLYDLVLKPLEAALGDASTVVFSPDSQLHFISFDALLDAKGAMACEKWNIRYTETGRDLLDKPNHTANSRNQTALLLGDPLYNQNPSDQLATSQPLDQSTNALLDSLNRDGAMPTGFIAKNRSGSRGGAGWESLSFGALPETGAELLKLGTLLESKQWQVKKLLQSEASESKLRGLTQGPAILHLATHGFFVNAPADDSLDRNASGGSEFLANSATKSGRPPTDPMLRSGMALTGAQHTLGQWNTGQVPDPGNDGMLLAAEVVNYNLSGTELVVLSACETARGKTLDGEGIYGLRRALKMAGADSVVMTLWPVNDAYTVNFMTDFYTRYLGGMHPCRALAETKKEHLLKLKNDPARGYAAAVRLVAPFIATGKGVEAVR